MFVECEHHIDRQLYRAIAILNMYCQHYYHSQPQQHKSYTQKMPAQPQALLFSEQPSLGCTRSVTAVHPAVYASHYGQPYTGGLCEATGNHHGGSHALESRPTVTSYLHDVSIQGGGIPVKSPPSPYDCKPPYSYISLIAMAIESSPDRRCTLSEIYAAIASAFPYYRRPDIRRRWQNSVRHSLSFNDCFVRLPPRTDDGGTSRGACWSVHPAAGDMFADGCFLRRPQRFRDRPSKSVNRVAVATSSQKRTHQCDVYNENKTVKTQNSENSQHDQDIVRLGISTADKISPASSPSLNNRNLRRAMTQSASPWTMTSAGDDVTRTDHAESDDQSGGRLTFSISQLMDRVQR